MKVQFIIQTQNQGELTPRQVTEALLLYILHTNSSPSVHPILPVLWTSFFAFLIQRAPIFCLDSPSLLMVHKLALSRKP